jgi:zinc protease
MFQLIHLYATTPRKDKDAFETMINELVEENRNSMSNPQQYFFNEYQKATSNNNIRRQGIFTEEELKGISFERAHEVYADRFSDFSDFTFTLVGNFKPEEIKPLLEKYIASLPSKNRKENWKDVGIYAPKEAINLELKKGLAAQSNVILSFQKDEKWDREKAMNVDAMVAVLNIMVRENLREEKGGVYSPFVGGGLSREPHGSSQVVVFFQCAPEDVEKLVEAVKEEIKSLQTNGPSADNMAKAKETRRRGLETNMKKNNFWMGTITESYKNNESPTKVFETEKMIENLKAEDIKNAATLLIDIDKAVIVTIKPEEKSDNDGKP